MKKITSPLIKIILGVVGILVVLFLVLVVAMSLAVSPLYAQRILMLGESDTMDYTRFPERVIQNSGETSPLPTDYKDIPQTVTYMFNGEQRTENLADLIQRTETKAFLVIQDDRIIYEVYPNSTRDAVNTSFSSAKSMVSTLIGAAIADGFIESVDDPVIRYVPEIAGRGLDEVTIRNLIQMDSGIEYIPNDQKPFFLHPFGDDAYTYYAPDLREIALSVRPGETPRGTAFNYNNYHLLLEGLILERATGMPVAQYMQERIWKPMGAEFPASWSLDSDASGFEKMESGINARAVDYARFGLIFLHNGFWNGTQILPEEWVQEATSPLQPDPRVWITYPEWPEYGGFYKYHWWGFNNPDGTYDYYTHGKFDQIVYVAPRNNVVVVRLGAHSAGDANWVLAIHALVDQLSE